MKPNNLLAWTRDNDGGRSSGCRRGFTVRVSMGGVSQLKNFSIGMLSIALCASAAVAGQANALTTVNYGDAHPSKNSPLSIYLAGSSVPLYTFAEEKISSSGAYGYLYSCGVNCFFMEYYPFGSGSTSDTFSSGAGQIGATSYQPGLPKQNEVFTSNSDETYYEKYSFFYGPLGNSSNNYDKISISQAGIYVHLKFEVSGITYLGAAHFDDETHPGLDFIEYQQLGGAVPEPATWALLVGGFALTGAALRRRRAGDLLTPADHPQPRLS